MLTRIDRIQLAVPNRDTAAEGWRALLGAEPSGEDRSEALAARRTRLRLGNGWVELLEADGDGPVARAVARRGAHLFAAGAATPDVAGLAARLREKGVEVVADGAQIHLAPEAAGLAGLRMVLSPDEPLAPVGRVSSLYEVTLLAEDAAPAVDRIAALFDLSPGVFVPIESKQFGYAGTLTLFAPDALHRLEVITPNQPEKTMGRFFERCGPCYYMAFAESAALEEIEATALERRAGCTPVPPGRPGERDGLDTLFLHPPALGGMMLGLSRPSMAWQWSGHPERVEPRR